MQQLWKNEQDFVNLSRGTTKPKLDEIFKNGFYISVKKNTKRRLKQNLT
jgi:hypothetical protein